MTREEQIKEAARQRADQYDHPSKWSDTYYGFIDGAKWADSHPQWIPVEKTNNTINVIFRKEQDGWHTYTQYGIDLPTSTAIEFGEHIAKAVNLLNGKGVTNE